MSEEGCPKACGREGRQPRELKGTQGNSRELTKKLEGTHGNSPSIKSRRDRAYALKHEEKQQKGAEGTQGTHVLVCTWGVGWGWGEGRGGATELEAQSRLGRRRFWRIDPPPVPTYRLPAPCLFLRRALGLHSLPSPE